MAITSHSMNKPKVSKSVRDPLAVGQHRYLFTTEKTVQRIPRDISIMGMIQSCQNLLLLGNQYDVFRRSIS
jgi:hypothetical protein